MPSLKRDRVNEINRRYLNIEMEYISKDQKATLKKLLDEGVIFKENASNSHLLYCLGMTDQIDVSRPCTYHVEGSGPDIDSDFSPSGRVKLFSALQEKYGKNNFVRIASYKPWSLKDSLVSFTKLMPQLNRDGENTYYPNGKMIYKPYQEGEAIKNQLPDAVRGRRTSWKLIKDDSSFDPIIAANQEVFSYAGPMDGQPMSASPHPCGCLISQDPITDSIPIRSLFEDVHVAQWETDVLESLNFIKYDILQLDNLDITQQTCANIGKPISWIDTIPLDDPKAMKMINSINSGGFNQIEANWITEIIMECQPKTVEDLAILISLIRPGPLDAGLVNDYKMFAKTGVMQNKLHPLLDDVLAETGGVLVYQEQVMKACSVLAGMDLATADQLRRAMG